MIEDWVKILTRLTVQAVSNIAHDSSVFSHYYKDIWRHSRVSTHVLQEPTGCEHFTPTLTWQTSLKVVFKLCQLHNVFITVSDLMPADVRYCSMTSSNASVVLLLIAAVLSLELYQRLALAYGLLWYNYSLGQLPQHTLASREQDWTHTGNGKNRCQM